MAEKTILKTLTDYFNAGDSKRPLREWGEEVKELSEAEKRNLAAGVAAITGDTVKGL